MTRECSMCVSFNEPAYALIKYLIHVLNEDVNQSRLIENYFILGLVAVKGKDEVKRLLQEALIWYHKEGKHYKLKKRKSEEVILERGFLG